MAKMILMGTATVLFSALITAGIVFGQNATPSQNSNSLVSPTHQLSASSDRAGTKELTK